MGDENNPYQSPSPSTPAQPAPKKTLVHPAVAYPIIGFLFGTCLIGPLILSADPIDRLKGGVMVGGTLGIVIGLYLGLRKAGL